MHEKPEPEVRLHSDLNTHVQLVEKTGEPNRPHHQPPSHSQTVQ